MEFTRTHTHIHIHNLPRLFEYIRGDLNIAACKKKKKKENLSIVSADIDGRGEKIEQFDFSNFSLCCTNLFFCRGR